MSRFLSGQLYVGIDRDVVGEQAGMFCLVICYAAQGAEIRRQEYEVYAAPLRHFYFPEAVERSFVTLFAARMLPGLQHGKALFLAEHHGIGLARRGAVEVARHDDGQPLGIFLEALLHQVGTLLLCRGAYVVEMGVGIEELLSRLLVLQDNPRHDTPASSTPGVAALHLRRIGEPEGAGLHQFVFILQIEYGAPLSAQSAVAPLAYQLVLGHAGLEVQNLCMDGFLEPEDVGLVVVNEGHYGLPPVCPYVLAVVRIQVADIELQYPDHAARLYLQGYKHEEK